MRKTNLTLGIVGAAAIAGASYFFEQRPTLPEETTSPTIRTEYAVFGNKDGLKCAAFMGYLENNNQPDFVVVADLRNVRGLDGLPIEQLPRNVFISLAHNDEIPKTAYFTRTGRQVATYEQFHEVLGKRTPKLVALPGSELEWKIHSRNAPLLLSAEIPKQTTYYVPPFSGSVADYFLYSSELPMFPAQVQKDRALVAQ
jgi:hypothetical protein